MSRLGWTRDSAAPWEILSSEQEAAGACFRRTLKKAMYLEYFDVKQTDWSPAAVATVLNRLQASGYRGLGQEVHGLLERFMHPRQDRAVDASNAGNERFTEILIPPAQPQTRVILHRPAADVARVVVIGRGQHEVHTAATAVKMHLEHAMGGKLKDLITDENGRASLTRFRRDVLPALGLLGDGRPSLRAPNGAALLKVLRGQPAIRGKPTVLASQISALSQDRPVEQTRDALEQLAADGVIERWHVVLCREGSHWLAVSDSPDEIKAFVATKVACPHCGRRVSEEKSDVAYCMSEDGQSYLSQKRWLCDLVETTLRRLGVEAVTVQPGGPVLDGAACYQGSVLLFRAREGVQSAADAKAVRDQARTLDSQGWRVQTILVTDQPFPAEGKKTGITVVEGVGALEQVLAEALNAARMANLQTLLPPVLHPISVSVAELLPADLPTPVGSAS